MSGVAGGGGVYRGEATGETEAHRASLAPTGVRREVPAPARPGPWGAAAQHLPAQDFTRVGEARGKRGVGRRRSLRDSQLSDRGPSQLRPPPLPSRRRTASSSRRLPRLPGDRGVIRRRAAARGMSPSPTAGPDADPRLVRVQAPLRPGPAPPPPPPNTDTILGRDIPQPPVTGPCFGRLLDSGRQDLGTPTLPPRLPG